MNIRPQSSRMPTTFGSLTRSELMARVRSRGNATTEIRMKELLRHHCVSGWRRHLALPGKPDFAWPQYKIAVFVDGCFWHGHDCGRNLTPKANAEFWRAKVDRNRKRDRLVSRQLRSSGWKVLRIWECVLRKRPNVVARRIQRAISTCE